MSAVAATEPTAIPRPLTQEQCRQVIEVEYRVALSAQQFCGISQAVRLPPLSSGTEPTI